MVRSFSAFAILLGLVAGRSLPAQSTIGARKNASATVEQFSVFEVELKAQGKHENPYRDLAAEAQITSPDGSSAKRAQLFWDGGQTWKLRFSPGLPGVWRYRIVSGDAGLNGAEGSLECVAAGRGGSIRPMKHHPLHFERQSGSPFWFLGDTAWGLFTDNANEKHDRTAALAYIDARAEQGVNVLHAMLLSEAGWGNQGGPPWHDLAAEQINPAYWQEVDRRLAHANRRGIVCGLALAWGDKRKQEPYAWRRFPGVEARKRYARYIAARYSAFDTYFLVSGEWHGEVRTRSSDEATVKREFIEIGDALHEADPHDRMVAIHPMTRHGSVREFVGAARWMAFGDYQQNYRELHARVLESRKAGKPVVNSEYGYFLRDQSGDGVPDKDNSTSLTAMRSATWDIVMAGGYPVTGFGTTYFGGHRDPGPFDLEVEKNKPWERQYAVVKTIFSELDWWRLEPHDELLTCNTPRGSDGREFQQLAPPATTYWCLAEPGQTYLVYFRGLTSPLRLALQKFSPSGTVSRINPRTGQREQLPSSSTDGYEIRPPDDQDWLMLLTAAR